MRIMSAERSDSELMSRSGFPKTWTKRSAVGWFFDIEMDRADPGDLPGANTQRIAIELRWQTRHGADAVERFLGRQAAGSGFRGKNSARPRRWRRSEPEAS